MSTPGKSNFVDLGREVSPRIEEAERNDKTEQEDIQEKKTKGNARLEKIVLEKTNKKSTTTAEPSGIKPQRKKKPVLIQNPAVSKQKKK